MCLYRHILIWCLYRHILIKSHCGRHYNIPTTQWACVCAPRVSATLRGASEETQVALDLGWTSSRPSHSWRLVWNESTMNTFDREDTKRVIFCTISTHIYTQRCDWLHNPSEHKKFKKIFKSTTTYVGMVVWNVAMLWDVLSLFVYFDSQGLHPYIW